MTGQLRLRTLAIALGLLCAVITAHLATTGAAESSVHHIHLPVTGRGLTGIDFEPVASGLTLITVIANAGDARRFVAQRDGHIRIIRPDGTIDPLPFLDIHTRVETSGNEQGLLGVAFHPYYAQNVRFYVYYAHRNDLSTSAPNIIAQFIVDPANPDRALPKSEATVLSIPTAGANHQGGALRFGLDGTLYIGVGDSTDAGLAQDPTSLRGKVLRIDVDSGGSAAYAIPPDNPFATSTTVRPELWALGLRNPYHLAIDPLTDGLIIADRGLHQWEEINLGGRGGLNFGWPCLEGTAVLAREPNCLPQSQFAPPAFAYDHNGPHCAVIGGEVYQGTQYPVLDGHYFFADFCSGAVCALLPHRTDAIQLRSALPVSWTAAGQTLTLAAESYRRDIGSLDETHLYWSSSEDGPLGTGEALSVDTLSGGVHLITLEVDDGYSSQVVDTSVVTIVDDPTLMPPPDDQLTDGPELILLHPQQVQLSSAIYINNADPDNVIAWSATSAEPWLTLSEIAGTTPQEITVTIDPRGLDAGDYSGLIEFSSHDAPEESAVVRVSFTMPEYRVGVPVVRR